MKTITALASIILLYSTAAAQPALLELNTAAPPAKLGIFDMVPFASDATPIGNSSLSVPVPLGSTPVGNVGFSTELFHYKANSAPLAWATWSNGFNGHVYHYDLTAVSEPAQTDSITLTLPASTKAFYFYVEPEFFGPFDFQISATTADGGSNMIPAQLINGQGNAKGYGFYVADAAAPSLTTVSIAGTDTWPGGFAIGQFAINGTPGPGVPDSGTTSVMLGAALAALAILAKRRLA